jgi:hypothetical protein
MYGPMVKWCGLGVPRVWRCGCQGNVASVLIEKPARGDFLPILDGGYGLQYSPLLEYREGEGMILFCQMDVSGRSETDPAAQLLARNVVWYAGVQARRHERRIFYAGEQAGHRYLEAAGFSIGRLPSRYPPESVLVLGPGCSKEITHQQVADWTATGGRIVAAGLSAGEVETLFAGKVQTRSAEHISSFFDTDLRGSWRTGVGPGDVHNRDPRELALITGGAEIVGDGVLGATDESRVVFCQIAPWLFDPAKPMNQKRTFRRASFLLSRLIANQGGAASTPLLDDATKPVGDAMAEKRWLHGLYLDIPEEWDDPYRFFPW